MISTLLSLVWSLASGKGGMCVVCILSLYSYVSCRANSFRRAGGLYGWRVRAATRAEAALIFVDAYMAGDIEKFQFDD